MIAGLVLAAGTARRFGAPKQLAALDGRPLLEHVLASLSSAPLDRTIVVLGAHAEEILKGVELHGAEPVLCREWEQGQAASLRAGLLAAADTEAVVVALGDQPLLSARAVARVLAARGPGAEAVRAAYDGRPGHPIVLERALFPRLATLSGDAGARDLLTAASVREIACDGLGRPDDVDTPEELEVVRA